MAMKMPGPWIAFLLTAEMHSNIKDFNNSIKNFRDSLELFEIKEIEDFIYYAKNLEENNCRQISNQLHSVIQENIFYPDNCAEFYSSIYEIWTKK